MNIRRTFPFGTPASVIAEHTQLDRDEAAAKSRDWREEELEKTGPVSCDEARAIAKRYNASHFGNHRDMGEHARYTIPVDFKRDDDVRLSAFITQAEQAGASKDNAYRERNMCVAALARIAIGLGWRVGMGKHDPSDTTWEDDWRNLVVIEGPTGQMTWHVHDSDMPLFEGIPSTDQAWPYVWDGHTTPQKYERLKAASVTVAKGLRSKEE